MSGVFIIAEGESRVKVWLKTADQRVDDWLYELSDSIVFHARDTLYETAPGGIRALVGWDNVDEVGPGLFEGSAGVLPDGPALPGPGSAKEDYPFYVEEGTGIYGELHSIIYPLVGPVMGPIPYRGRDIFVRSSKGQPGQHYGREAYEETVAWTPGRIELAKASLYAETEAAAHT